MAYSPSQKTGLFHHFTLQTPVIDSQCKTRIFPIAARWNWKFRVGVTSLWWNDDECLTYAYRSEYGAARQPVRGFSLWFWRFKLVAALRGIARFLGCKKIKKMSIIASRMVSNPSSKCMQMRWTNINIGISKMIRCGKNDS